VKKLLLPLLFVLLFLLESIFVQFLPAKPFGFDKVFVPHFLFEAILFLTIFVGTKQGIIYAMIFGFAFDIVYVEVLGIYLFLYAIVAYIVSKIMHAMHANLLISSVVTLFGIAILEIGVYEMNTIIHVTSLDFTSFLNMRLYPTLLLNAAFILILGYPLKRYFEKYAQALRAE
jgi:rod shape-determining protein MreD